MEKLEENYSHVIIKEENLNETELDSAQPSLINFENDANIVFHSRQDICEQQEVEIPKIKTNHATIETPMILNLVDNNVNKDAHYDLTENTYQFDVYLRGNDKKCQKTVRSTTFFLSNHSGLHKKRNQSILLSVFWKIPNIQQHCLETLVLS